MKLLCLLIVVVGMAAANTGVQLNLYAVDPFTHTRDLTGHFSLPVVGHHPVNVKDVYLGPIVVITPNFQESATSGSLLAFVATQGLSSLSNNNNFKPFYDHLLTSGKLAGLVFFSGSIGNSILQFPIEHLTLPDNLRTADLLHLIDNSNIPVVYIAPTDVFNNNHFIGLFPLASFTLLDEFVAISEISGPYSPNSPVGPGFFPLSHLPQLPPPGPLPIAGVSDDKVFSIPLP